MAEHFHDWGTECARLNCRLGSEEAHRRYREAAQAPVHAAYQELVSAAEWVLTDAAYKAPEQVGLVAGRWVDRLRTALEKVKG